MASVLLLNGPNLNLLGEREPQLYGTTSLRTIEDAVRERIVAGGHTCDCFQANEEGALVSWLQEHRHADFLLLNAAAYTHTSVALRDTVRLSQMPFVEIHLSNVYAREDFRQRSYFSDLAEGVIAGFGMPGYLFAAQYALKHLEAKK